METSKYLEDDTTNKVIIFLKKNILNFVLVAVVACFLIKNLLEITESGKSVAEIIADSTVSFVMGFTINTIMQKKGIFAAQETNSYIQMIDTYNKEIEKTDAYIEKLDDFCDEKNDIRYKKAQIRVLRTERIKYDDFIKKEKSEVCKDKVQEKCWDKARRVKIHWITPDNLLSETDENYDKGGKEETLKEHEKKERANSSVTKLILGFIFGYYTVAPMINGTNFLWSVFQVSLWLSLGLMTYYNNYAYVKNVYQQKIYRKIKYLTEFNSRYGKEQNNGNKEESIVQEEK